jgi:hypothetical protein
VLLRHVGSSDKWYLTQPLAAHKSVQSHYGVIPHTDIIGRSPRDILATNRGTEFRLTWPTLDEYVTKVPRMVTPVCLLFFCFFFFFFFFLRLVGGRAEVGSWGEGDVGLSA